MGLATAFLIMQLISSVRNLETLQKKELSKEWSKTYNEVCLKKENIVVYSM